jgi:hypothetical protein
MVWNGLDRKNMADWNGDGLVRREMGEWGWNEVGRTARTFCTDYSLELINKMMRLFTSSGKAIAKVVTVIELDASNVVWLDLT